jgi:cephalosporin hydroxylase
MPDFFEKRAAIAERNWNDPTTRKAATDWHDAARRCEYQYLIEWMGRPIIQDPQDVCYIQEIIWRVKPDVIVETGVARGGSLVLSASILAAISQGEWLETGQLKARKVIGVDIDIRPHNRAALEVHPLAKMISLIQGSSIAPEVVAEVKSQAGEGAKVLVFLDSHHTRDHVFEELLAYSPLVGPGSAIFIMDTGIEHALADSFHTVRPWGPGNSPLTAVNDFLALEQGKDFTKDLSIEKRLLITCATEGLIVRR